MSHDGGFDTSSSLFKDLIERDQAISEISRLYADAAAGKGRLTVIEGPTGSGKSKLMQSVLEDAQDSGALALGATALLSERSLPFGILMQLCSAVRIPVDFRCRLVKLLDSLQSCKTLSKMDPQSDPVRIGEIIHEISQVLIEIAEVTPLVIGIDNVHHMDVASMQCASRILPRLKLARILIVLTNNAAVQPLSSSSSSELIGQAQPHRIHLHPLSCDGVASLTTIGLGDEATPDLATEFAEISGGNLAVLRSLISHWHMHSGHHASGYGEALLTCLLNCEPVTLRVVRALAVLGDNASPAGISCLAHAESSEVGRVIDALNAARLLKDGAFRHPAGARAVLAQMPRRNLGQMRREAAKLLDDEGAPALVVVRQLIDVGNKAGAWEARVLLAAADEALSANQMETAAEYLRLALRASREAPFRGTVQARLSRVEWQISPTASLRHLRPLFTAFSASHLQAPEWNELLWLLCWYGWVNDAESVIDAVEHASDAGHGAHTQDLDDLRTWFTFTYPARSAAKKPDVRTAIEAAPAEPDARLSVAANLAGFLIRGQVNHATERAEEILQTLCLSNTSFWSGETGVLALLSLVYADRLETAAAWCDKLLTEAEACGSLTWRALFTAVRAQIALQVGDLPAAYAQAREALALIPRQGWGVALGLPLGTAVLACVRMGKLDEAEQYVSQSPPEAMLRSQYGLHYLYARGQYRLTISHTQAALADFLSCGRLTETWGVRSADVVPWQAGTAEAWLKQGDRDQARYVIREQLAKQPSDAHRARGILLRVLAEVSQQARRPQLLYDAVRALTECGDRYELARTLTDLGCTLQDNGDFRGARRASRRAWKLAVACQADSLLPCLGSDRAAGPALPVSPGGEGVLLTEQERKVASLAAEGYTNQEIAARLCITQSTVEQHLTRTFRKLKVKRRQDLPLDLVDWERRGNT